MVPRYIVNAGMMAVQSLVQKTSGFVTTALLARFLEATGLGAYSAAATTASTAQGLFRFGIDAGAHVLTAGLDPSESPADVERIMGTAFTLFLGLGALTTIFCFGFADLLANGLFGDANLVPFVLVGGGLAFAQAMTQFAYITFAGLHAFRPYVRQMLVIGPGVAVGCIAGGLVHGALGAAVALVAGQGVGALMLIRLARAECGKYGARLRLLFDRRSAMRLLSLGLPFYAVGVLGIPVEYAAQGSLVRLHEVASLGELRVVVALTSLLGFLPTAIAGPMISAFTKAHADDPDGGRRLVWVNVKVLWLFGLMAATALGLMWAEALHALMGQGYEGAERVGALALATSVLGILLSLVHGALLSSRRVGLLFGLGMVHLVVFALGAFFAIPSLGLAGYLSAQLAGHTLALAAASITFVSSPVAASSQRRAVTAMWIGGFIGATVVLGVSPYGANLHVALRLCLAPLFLGAIAAWALYLVFDSDDLAALRRAARGLIHRIQPGYSRDEESGPGSEGDDRQALDG